MYDFFCDFLKLRNMFFSSLNIGPNLGSDVPKVPLICRPPVFLLTTVHAVDYCFFTMIFWAYLGVNIFISQPIYVFSH
jgi:hypothetical protein